MITLNPLATPQQNSTKNLKNSAKKTKDGKRLQKERPSLFDLQTKEIQNIDSTENINEGLTDLLNDLYEQEKRFLDIQSLQELEEYRKLIHQVLKLAEENDFLVSSVSWKRKIGKTKRPDSIIVKQIDNKLNEITKKLQGSNQAFNLLKDIQDIRGLICDLIY